MLVVGALAVGCAALEVRGRGQQSAYAHSDLGIARVVERAMRLEQREVDATRQRLGLNDDLPYSTAITPHIGHLYGLRTYLHVMPFVRARHVVLIGVAHGAHAFPASEGRLVFDSHRAWTGPYGEVPVSPLRQELCDALPSADAWVSDALHASEHSLDAVIPFLQHFNREVEIIPVLVPYMSDDRLFALAERSAAALTEIMRCRGLQLGTDVALLISSDSVHYGDLGWRAGPYVDLGVSGAAYDRAVERDHRLIADYLTGQYSLAGLGSFYRELLHEDFHRYKIAWCGRFSVPFGLAVTLHLHAGLGLPPPRGDLLNYATTLDPGGSDPEVQGLHATVWANLRHWVGFCAIGYRPSSEAGMSAEQQAVD